MFSFIFLYYFYFPVLFLSKSQIRSAEAVGEKSGEH